MSPLRVSTVITDIRDSIPNDLMALTSLLSERGWKLSITTETRVDVGVRARVIAEKQTWLNYPLSSYEVSYRTPDLQEHSIIQSARKLTELCLQLDEVFFETFPAEMVSADGCIYEDPGRAQAAKDGAIALLRYIQDQHRQTQSGSENRIYFRFGFMNLVWDAQEVIMQQSDLVQLESFVREKHRRQ